jgi:gas vesicle protein
MRESKSLKGAATTTVGAPTETKYVSQQWSKNVANLTSEVKGQVSDFVHNHINSDQITWQCQ